MVYPVDLTSLEVGLVVGLQVSIIFIAVVAWKGGKPKPKKNGKKNNGKNTAPPPPMEKRPGAFTRFRKWLKRDIKDVRKAEPQEETEEGSTEGGRVTW